MPINNFIFVSLIRSDNEQFVDIIEIILIDEERFSIRKVQKNIKKYLRIYTVKICLFLCILQFYVITIRKTKKNQFYKNCLFSYKITIL